MPDEMLDGGINSIEAPPVAPAKAKGSREVQYSSRDGGADKQRTRTSSFSSVGFVNNAERDNWSSHNSRDHSSGEKQNHAMTSLFSSISGGGGNTEKDREGGGRVNQLSCDRRDFLRSHNRISHRRRCQRSYSRLPSPKTKFGAGASKLLDNRYGPSSSGDSNDCGGGNNHGGSGGGSGRSSRRSSSRIATKKISLQ